MESKIGNKVKKLRLSLGMSQEEFGKKLGYTSRSSINKIEKGINDISYDKLILLIKEYNIDLKSIVDDENTNISNAHDKNSNIYISFSGRAEGNCFDIAHHLMNKKDTFIPFKDISYNPCSNCNYECFKEACKYRDDEIYSLIETSLTYKNIILLIASLLFYFYGEPKYVFLMIAEIIIAYIGAILIDKYKNQSKNILIITLFIHVLLLIIFKYTDFIIQTINDISNANIKLLNIALPIGISFYTFQIISYIIDVYNGKVKVQKNIIKLATYVSLFPQLVAGPIVRYQTVEKELDNRTHSFNNFAYGIRRFSIGLAKKVLIANALGELCTKAFALNETTIIFYWIFGISYMLQLYFDFSAYSDMAIGLGRIFGFHFPENFNYPYISKSITEFWRRWHISLSTWFKDYIYIPLGGNREGKYKQIRNILIVWLLTGIWHGANWTFLIWGLLFGIILIIEKIFLNKFMEKLPSFIRRIYVLFIVMILFIIFNSDNMSVALTNIKGLFGMNGEAFVNDYTLHYLKSYLPVLIIALLGSTPFIKILIDKLRKNKYVNNIINILEPILIVVILVVVTSYLIDNSYNPFLYFRF